jgi:hypothetical protein
MRVASRHPTFHDFKVGNAQRQRSTKHSPVNLSLQYDSAAGFEATATIRANDTRRKLLPEKPVEETALFLLRSGFLCSRLPCGT